jgi:hypothetical protein
MLIMLSKRLRLETCSKACLKLCPTSWSHGNSTYNHGDFGGMEAHPEYMQVLPAWSSGGPPEIINAHP